MNAILKAILVNAGKAAEVAVAGSIPGGAEIDAAARAVIAQPHSVDAAVAAAIAAVHVLETDYGVQFANEPDFQIGILQVKAGLTSISKALHKGQ